MSKISLIYTRLHGFFVNSIIRQDCLSSNRVLYLIILCHEQQKKALAYSKIKHFILNQIRSLEIFKYFLQCCIQCQAQKQKQVQDAVWFNFSVCLNVACYYFLFIAIPSSCNSCQLSKEQKVSQTRKPMFPSEPISTPTKVCPSMSIYYPLSSHVVILSQGLSKYLSYNTEVHL